jgi:hypothetical protein
LGTGRLTKFQAPSTKFQTNDKHEKPKTAKGEAAKNGRQIDSAPIKVPDRGVLKLAFCRFEFVWNLVLVIWCLP